MSLTSILLLVAFILLLALAASAAWVYSSLQRWRGLRLRRMKGLVVERESIPADDRDWLDLACKPLEDLGFAHIYSLATKPLYASRPAKPAYLDIYEHPAVHAQAHVSIFDRSVAPFIAATEVPKFGTSAPVPYVIWFVTGFSDQTNIITMNQFQHHLGLVMPEWFVYDDYASNIQESWRAHQQVCGTTGKVIEVDGIEVFKRMQWLMHSKIDQLASAGLVEPVPTKKRWRYTWRGAWFMWNEYRQGIQRAKIANRQASRTNSANSPVGFDRRHNSASLLNIGEYNRRENDPPNDFNSDLPVITTTSRGGKNERSGGGVEV